MSLSKSKSWYSNNCLQFLEHTVPLYDSVHIYKFVFNIVYYGLSVSTFSLKICSKGVAGVIKTEKEHF